MYLESRWEGIDTGIQIRCPLTYTITYYGACSPFISDRVSIPSWQVLAHHIRRFRTCGFLCWQSPCFPSARDLPSPLTPMRSFLLPPLGSKSNTRKNDFWPNTHCANPFQHPRKKFHPNKQSRFLPPLRLILDFSGHVLVLSGQRKLSMTRRLSTALSPFRVPHPFPFSFPHQSPLFSSQIRKRSPSSPPSFHFRSDVTRSAAVGGGWSRVHFMQIFAKSDETLCVTLNTNGRFCSPLTPLCRRNQTVDKRRGRRARQTTSNAGANVASRRYIQVMETEWPLWVENHPSPTASPLAGD